jgi:cold shock CspA family protein/ribosome-associated translation inhibitor RaiA
LRALLRRAEALDALWALPEKRQGVAASPDQRFGEAFAMRRCLKLLLGMNRLCHVTLAAMGQNMQVPLDISFQNCEPSEAIRSEIERHASRLEKFHDHITACHVAVTAPSTRHHEGNLFSIRIRVAMPQHKDIVVTKTHGDMPQHEHIKVAIKDAFALAQRQIEDAARDMRGQVKQHEPQQARGRVARFLAGEDCGFIETADGREIYFHRNSVLEGAFDRLTVGSEVRFVEEMGEKGPQASTVHLIGKHHLS